MWLWAGPCEAVNLIRVSGPGQLMEVDNWNEILSIYWPPGGQIKAAGQEGIIESAWVPIDGGPPAPRARAESGKGNTVKGAERGRK
jgi:hypothetical protein